MRGTIRSVAVLPTILVLAILQLALPARADAQSAWLPFEGEASVSLTFQSLDYRGHFVEDGTKLEGVLPSRAQISVMELRIRADGSARVEREPPLHRVKVHRHP